MEPQDRVSRELRDQGAERRLNGRGKRAGDSLLGADLQARVDPRVCRRPSRGVAVSGSSGQRLFQPVVGKRLVIERRHLDPSGRSVERERLDEDRACLNVRDAGSARRGACLQSLQ